MNIKHNIPLMVGLALPVAMILFVIASIYVPGLFIKPHYDFLYAASDYHYPMYYEKSGEVYIEHRFSVRGGHLVEETTPSTDKTRLYAEDRPKLYVYDVETDTNKEVSIEQAGQFSLDENKKSPDGFEITYGSSDGGVFPFIFWSDRDYDKRYLKTKNASREISVNTSGRYNGFHFIGWIIE